MALRLGRTLGNGPGIWLRMQQAVDLLSEWTGLADVLDSLSAGERESQWLNSRAIMRR